MKRPITIFKESLTHYRTFFSTYISFSAWILVPTIGLAVLDLFAESAMASALAFVVVIVGSFIVMWTNIIMVHLAAKLDQTPTPDMQAIQTQSVKQIIPLMIVSFLQLLMYVGGLLLLVVPLFLCVVWFTFAQSSVLLDNKRGLEALTTSKALVKGRFWPTAWGAILFPGIVIMGFFIVTMSVIALAGVVSGQDLAMLFLENETEPIWASVINTISQMLWIPLMTIYSTKFYLFMKHSKPNPSLEKGCEIT